MNQERPGPPDDGAVDVATSWVAVVLWQLVDQASHRGECVLYLRHDRPNRGLGERPGGFRDEPQRPDHFAGKCADFRFGCLFGHATRPANAPSKTPAMPRRPSSTIVSPERRYAIGA